MSSKSTQKLKSNASDVCEVQQFDVELTYYPPEEDCSLPSVFSYGHHRPVYPYQHKHSQYDSKQNRAFKVVQLRNKYISVDILPELGGHVWGARDLVANKEMFHRTDEIKLSDLAVAGPWMASGIEFNFPVTHSVLTVDQVDCCCGTEDDGQAWVKVGAVDKLFGLQWQMNLVLKPNTRALDIYGWLHNPTDSEHPFCYWGNAGITAKEDLKLSFPYKYAEHHGGRLFKWPEDLGVDMSWWKNLNQPASIFGESDDKRFFGGYFMDDDYGIVHSTYGDELPGKKYFTWGNGAPAERWAKLLSGKGDTYVELQSGTRNDQEFWDTLKPHASIHFHERWQPVDGIGDILDANPYLTVNIVEDGSKPVLKALSTESLSNVCIHVSDREGALIEKVERDFADNELFSHEVDYEGPIRVEISFSDDMPNIQTESLSLFDYGKAPLSREEILDVTQKDPAVFKQLAINEMQGSRWEGAKIWFDEALALAPDDLSLKRDVGLFYYRQHELTQAQSLLKDCYDAGCKEDEVVWALLNIAWRTKNEDLKISIMSQVNLSNPLAVIIDALRNNNIVSVIDLIGELDLTFDVSNKDLALVAYLALKKNNTPSPSLLDALIKAYPLDPIIRTLANDDEAGRLAVKDADVFCWVLSALCEFGCSDIALQLYKRHLHSETPGAIAVSKYLMGIACAWDVGDDEFADEIMRLLPKDNTQVNIEDMPWQGAYYDWLDRFAEKAGDSAHVLWACGLLLKKVGRSKEALVHFDKARSLGCKTLELLMSAAMIKRDLQDVDDTLISQIEDYVNAADSSEMHMCFVELLRESGMREKCLTHLKSRFGKSRDYEGVKPYYVMEMMALGRYEECLDFINNTVFPTTHGIGGLSFAHIFVRTRLAKQCIANGNKSDAYEHLRKSMEVLPQFNEDTQILHALAEAYCCMGDLLKSDGKNEEAMQWYKRAAEEDHAIDSPLRIWQAIGKIKSGLIEEGKEDFDRVERFADIRLAMPLPVKGFFYYLKWVIAEFDGDKKTADDYRLAAINSGWAK